MSNRKRKYDVSPTAGDLDDHLLHIQAYEADIRCSPTSARSLEANGPHAGEALIKHPTGDSEIWLDRCVRYTPPVTEPRAFGVLQSGNRYPLNLRPWFVACPSISFPSIALEGPLLTCSISDTMHASSWIRYPLIKGQENDSHHPHLGGPISLRIQRTLSSSVRRKSKITVEISVAVSWKAPARKGCGR